jgi:hypothetical protein
MVYNIQNHWISGLCSSYRILKTRQYVSETASISRAFLLVCRMPGDGPSPETSDSRFHSFSNTVVAELKTASQTLGYM